MNWKQHLTSRWQKRTFKRAQRLLRNAGQYATSLILRGKLPELAAPPLLNEQAKYAPGVQDTGKTVEILRFKQGVVSLAAGDRFIRATRRDKGARKLLREHENWRFLRNKAVTDRISPVQVCTQTPDGWTLLSEKRMQPVEKEELWPAMALVLPPLLEQATREPSTLPASVETGHRLVLEATEGRPPERLPSLKDLQAAFARPIRQGFFHADLHRGNVMLCDGRYRLIDLKSCMPDRIASLELLQLIARSYPDAERPNKLLRIFEAEADKWQAPEIAPIAEMVDLPRELWAGIYFYDAIGRTVDRDTPQRKVHSFARTRLQSTFRKQLLRRLVQQL